MKKEAKRAATLVLIRDGNEGLEVLLLRRHRQLRVGAGNWVFPGGSIDAADGPLGADEQTTAKRAAIRETREESSLEIAERDLQLLSHWTTPSGYPFRFATWFFLAEAGFGPVVVDGEEMDDYCWSSPGELLASHQSGEKEMLPPTVVTLTELSRCATVAQARTFYAAREVPFIEPRRGQSDDPMCMMYPGDAGYETADDSVAGARNRCYLEQGVWRYEFFMGLPDG